ncbi:cytochrome P450 71AU50 [Cryptomeria japonica]|uniref:cytochrome P450 71AU50 n=1 Tax=Cryptomeria japonica TaxID=3369 RepID=UPI0027DA3C8C|nr:cytochrome P450 71AU50 [Cryptomeria japonica]
MAWLNSPAVELVFSLIFLWTIYRFVTTRKSKNNQGELGLPPGPRPWPVIGNLHLLGSLPHKSLAELGNKYGPIMFLRLGSVPTVVASSPAMAKEFLKTHDLIFANRPPSATGKYLACERRDVAQAPYGEYWRQMRKLCTIELLTAKRTDSFRWVREEEVRAMVRSLWEESEKGVRCVDLRKPISSLTLNIICRMFAGRTYSDHELGGGKWFLQMVAEIMHLSGVIVVGDFIPSLAFLDWRGYCRRMQDARKVFDEFFDKLIDEHVERRRSKKSDDPDIVDVLLDMAESETAEIQVSRIHIKAIIMDMLSAGVETSATTIEWAMTEMLRNPQVMERAQQEIELEVGRDRIVRESDLVNLDYLRCVVKETFRLHPPAPLLIPHESTQGCNVGGYYIPPKTRLLVNVWAIGRDESVWEDPLEFKPERFIGSSIDVKGHHFEMLSFGTGRRQCPGIAMGLSVVHLAVAQLIHCFHWSVEGDLDRDEECGLTVPRKFPIFALPSWRLTTNEPP